MSTPVYISGFNSILIQLMEGFYDGRLIETGFVPLNFVNGVHVTPVEYVPFKTALKTAIVAFFAAYPNGEICLSKDPVTKPFGAEDLIVLLDNDPVVIGYYITISPSYVAYNMALYGTSTYTPGQTVIGSIPAVSPNPLFTSPDCGSNPMLHQAS